MQGAQAGGARRKGHTTTMRAVQPQPVLPSEPFTPDAVQASVLAAGSGAHTIIWGAAGTGKTRLIVELVAERLSNRAGAGLDPESIMVLAATRTRAAELRNQVSARIQTLSGAAMVRTPSSLAFAILRGTALQAGKPAPQLLTGPEFDNVLADLLEGHRHLDSGPTWPTRIRPEVRLLPEFRTELRDVIMRAAEIGLDGHGLITLGKQQQRGEWVAAGELLTEFDDVARLAGGSTIDHAPKLHSSQLISAACDILREHRASPTSPTSTAWQHPWRVVIVDDFQEVSEATARLLDELEADGVELILCSNPDVAVQTFRGALPQLGQHAPKRWQNLPWREYTLHTPHRYRAAQSLGEFGALIANHLPLLAPPALRLQTPADPNARDENPRVAYGVYSSSDAEHASVAAMLRRAHLEAGTPWHDMAVIVRSASEAYRWRTALNRAGVTTRYTGNDLPLHAHEAVWPLLRVIDIALHPETLTSENAELLLYSVYGRSNSVDIRRFRRALRAADRSIGHSRSSDELMCLTLNDLERFTALVPALNEHAPDSWPHAVHRIAAMIAATRDAHAQNLGPELTLWAAWEASGQEQRWRNAVLNQTSAAATADQHLDSVTMLFAAAARAVDQSAHISIETLVNNLKRQTTAEDNLANQSTNSGVAIMTPASAAGHQWAHVYLCSIQDGAWPNTKLRSTLLGAGDIAEAAAGRDPDALNGTDEFAAEARRNARRAVIADELRLFTSSFTRARDRVFVSAHQTEETTPSTFMRLVRQLGAHRLQDANTALDAAPETGATGDTGFESHFDIDEPTANLDLRQLIAELRHTGMAYERYKREADPAQGATPEGIDLTQLAELVTPTHEILAHLAVHGVAAAHPQTWYYAQAPSEMSTLYAPDQLVPLSPSTLESLNECALRWHLQRSGGDKAATTAQIYGTLVHEIAAAHPTGSPTELDAALAQKWQALRLPDTWLNRLAELRTKNMVRGLANYIEHAPAPIAVESPFDFELHGAKIRGSADRIHAVDGGYAVIDFKTSKTQISVGDAETNPQIAAYQLAIREGGLSVTETTQGQPDQSPKKLPPSQPHGGQLVYLGHGTKGFSERSQPALYTSNAETHEDEQPQQATFADDLVREAVAAVRSERIAAVKNSHCNFCPVRRSCPHFSTEVPA